MKFLKLPFCKCILGGIILSYAMPTSSQPYTPVPQNKDVKVGTLSNGLTYYLMHNEKPAKRADFYIVQKVGSIQEEENQRGLAHFLEHMAFHDTKNFPNNRLIGYLEENGVKFGTNLNASTSIDQTIYNISNVPTARHNLVDSCLLILHDWSGFITLKDEDIESEKKVIHEEWRTRSDADQRMLESILPQVYSPDSRYPKRVPIGLMKVVDNVSHQALRDYYHKWYRPDLQAVIIVGDIDVDAIEKSIYAMWKDIPYPSNPTKRVYYEVPNHQEPLVGIAKDKESKSNSLQILFNYQTPSRQEAGSIENMQNSYYRSMISSMLNSRLDETIAKGGSPFINATALDGPYLVSTSEMSYGIGAGFRTGDWKNTLAALVAELKRIKAYGFRESEYERAKSKLLVIMENAYNNRLSRSNSEFVSQCINNFLLGSPIVDIDFQNQFYTQATDTTSLATINEVAKKYLCDSNQVILLMGEDRTEFPMPTHDEVLKAYQEDWEQEVKPYIDSVSNTPLLKDEDIPQPGKIVKTWKNKNLGTINYLLSNGAKVVIKHTEFKKNNISLKAYSPGGTSLYPIKDMPSCSSINAVAGVGGLGRLSALELTKLMAGKNAKMQFSVDTYGESLFGSCSPRYMETMLQMLYLCFQGPRADNEAFQTWKSNIKSSLLARDLSMESVMQDTINNLLYSNNPRLRTFKTQTLARVNYRKVLQIFKERFSNASDFTFTFVGNIDIEQAKPLIEKYIGSIPSDMGKKEKAKDVIPYINKGIIRRVFQYPMETPKTMVQISYAGKMKYSLKNRMKLSILRQILEMVYINTLRQQEGGTYGAQVSESLNRKPKDQYILNINFTTSGEAYARLVDRAKSDLLQIAQNGPDKDMFDKAIKYMTKRHNDLLKENAYWMAVISDNNEYGSDDYTHYFDDLHSITPCHIKQVAADILKAPSQIDIIMEGFKK